MMRLAFMIRRGWLDIIMTSGGVCLFMACVEDTIGVG